jgi:acyl carrier protein
MNAPTTETVRNFLVALYGEKIKEAGHAGVTDDFDLLLAGIIDSMGVLELVGALEKEYGIELDMSGMDTEKLTVIGPLAAYVAAQAAGSKPAA